MKVLTSRLENKLTGCKESVLEELLVQHPNAFPVREINPSASAVLTVGNQVDLAGNAADIFWLDDTGQVYIVECKMLSNAESRRSVVSQLIEYGSYVYRQWSGEKVLSLAAEYFKCEDPFVELERRFVAAFKDMQTEKEFNPKGLKDLKTSKEGDLHIGLVLATDSVDNRALDLVEFIRKVIKGKSGKVAALEPFDLACVECRHISLDGQDYFSCNLKSSCLIETFTASQRTRLDQEEWLNGDEASTPYHGVREIVLETLKRWKESGLCEFEFGHTSVSVKVENSRCRTSIMVFYFATMSINREGFLKLGMDHPKYAKFLKTIEESLDLRAGTLRPEREQYCTTSLKGLLDEQKRTGFFQIVESTLRELKAMGA